MHGRHCKDGILVTANFMKKTFTFGFVLTTTQLTSGQVFWGTVVGKVEKGLCRLKRKVIASL